MGAVERDSADHPGRMEDRAFGLWPCRETDPAPAISLRVTKAPSSSSQPLRVTVATSSVTASAHMNGCCCL